MKGSALEPIVTAAFGRIRGIFNVKSWVKDKRVFWSVAAALLQHFLSTGQNTLYDIEQYLIKPASIYLNGLASLRAQSGKV